MRLVRALGAIAVLAFAVPSSGLAVAPLNPQVVQDGAFFRVSWTPDADSTTGVTAVVSNAADFSGTTCSSTSLFSNQTQPAGTLRVWCPIAFGDTVYVRVTNAGGESTDIQAPSASFDFRPIGPNTSGTVRNRQIFTCRFDPREWQRMNDEDYAITKMSLWVGGKMRVEEATFTANFTNAPVSQQTALKGSDVGSTARCLTTMTYGAYTGTSVRTYRVVHALPEQMQPTMILQEAPFPRAAEPHVFAPQGLVPAAVHRRHLGGHNASDGQSRHIARRRERHDLRDAKSGRPLPAQGTAVLSDVASQDQGQPGTRRHRACHDLWPGHRQPFTASLRGDRCRKRVGGKRLTDGRGRAIHRGNRRERRV